MKDKAFDQGHQHSNLADGCDSAADSRIDGRVFAAFEALNVQLDPRMKQFRHKVSGIVVLTGFRKKKCRAAQFKAATTAAAPLKRLPHRA
jgi:hypothetical protein